MNTAETLRDQTKSSTFKVGELIYPAELQATFRVLSVGTQGMRIQLVDAGKNEKGQTRKIVPKAPYLVTFKNVTFKIVGWSGKEFTIHTTNE